MQNWFSHVILKKCTSWNIIFDIDENKMKLFLLFYSNLSAFIIFQMENLEMRWVEGFKYSHFGSTCSCTQNMQCRKKIMNNAWGDKTLDMWWIHCIYGVIWGAEFSNTCRLILVTSWNLFRTLQLPVFLGVTLDRTLN